MNKFEKTAGDKFDEIFNKSFEGSEAVFNSRYVLAAMRSIEGFIIEEEYDEEYDEENMLTHNDLTIVDVVGGIEVYFSINCYGKTHYKVLFDSELNFIRAFGVLNDGSGPAAWINGDWWEV